jgi:hypothetical protein
MEDDAAEEMVGEDLLPLVLGPAGGDCGGSGRLPLLPRRSGSGGDDRLLREEWPIVPARGGGRQRGVPLAAGFVLLAPGVRQVLDDALGPDLRREQQQRASSPLSA